MSTLLWVVVPYVCLAVFVVGHFVALPLRQVRLDHPLLPALRAPAAALGSPLFHFGMLGVFVGHVIGLLVPEVLDRRGRDERARSTTSWRSSVGWSPA